MTTSGLEQLSGYVMRDYEQTVATLRRSWLDQGLSQEVIAGRMGWSRPTVGKLLAGDVGATMPRLFALAHALGFDLALIPGRSRE